jgi:DNA-binding FadR family transcriptional regulator
MCDKMEDMHNPTSASHLLGSVVEGWGRDIVFGQTAPGTRILTDQMVNSLQVSRTVVREAVRILEGMGLVEVTRRVGITVLPPERWSPFDANVLRWRLAGPDRMACLRSLSELRAAVEPAAARLAATNATPEHCGALSGAVMGMAVTARAANAEDYLDHDVIFHQTLLLASGNPMFAGMRHVVTAVLAGRTHHALMPEVANSEALRLHGVVASAVQSGDGIEAEHAMQGIVAESTEAIEAMAVTAR